MPEFRNAGTPEYENPEHKVTKTRNAWKIKINANKKLETRMLGSQANVLLDY